MIEALRAAVLGHPVSHSLSPALHRAAYQELGLPWSYDAIDVPSGGLADFLAQMGPEWGGLSLTMPLKVEAVPLMDFVEPLAKVVGAVNTVVIQRFADSRHLVGGNTDVHGVMAALAEAGLERATSAVVLGAGATATSAMAALGHLGVVAPVIVARDRSRAGGLIRAATRMGLRPRMCSFEAAPDEVARAEVVVSTIPADAGAEVGASLIEVPSGAVLLDVVYDPPVTALAARWVALGGVSVGGDRMLLHQAAEQVRLMTGRPAPVAAMDAALRAELNK